MAVVKIGQIRSTLKAAIEYIVNPAKTRGGIMTSSNAGIPSIADSVHTVMEMTLRDAHNARATGRPPTVLAYHVIQSFKPGEIEDPNLAHDIGVQFAQRITDGGKYDYVIATHLDRDHLHNHIIFSAVNRETLKRFRCPKSTVFRFREISDELCREHGLSVIETPGRNVPPGEVYARASGRSVKAILEAQIDEAVRSSYSWESMKENLAEAGIKVDFRGGHIIFNAPELTDKTFRGKTLGPAYTEQALMARLGRESLAEFIVQPRLVYRLDEQRYRVKVPGRGRGKYLIVGAHHLNDHGTHWRMYLPVSFQGRYTDAFGALAGKTDIESLYEFFSRPDPLKMPIPTIAKTSSAGVSEKQKRYYALVDKKVDEVRAVVEDFDLRRAYEQASDKKEFVHDLASEVAALHAELQQAIVDQQLAADAGQDTILIDRKISLAARRIIALRTTLRDLQKQAAKQAKEEKTKQIGGTNAKRTL